MEQHEIFHTIFQALNWPSIKKTEKTIEKNSTAADDAKRNLL